jgi:hypothetical protein
VNEDDDGGFGFYFWINDECLNGAISVLESYVFVMAGRCFEAGFCLVLRLDGRGCEKQKQDCDGEP